MTYEESIALKRVEIQEEAVRGHLKRGVSLVLGL